MHAAVLSVIGIAAVLLSPLRGACAFVNGGCAHTDSVWVLWTLSVVYFTCDLFRHLLRKKKRPAMIVHHVLSLLLHPLALSHSCVAACIPILLVQEGSTAVYLYMAQLVRSRPRRLRVAQAITVLASLWLRIYYPATVLCVADSRSWLAKLPALVSPAFFIPFNVYAIRYYLQRLRAEAVARTHPPD